TQAYLQYGEAAFDYLERLLEREFGLRKAKHRGSSLGSAEKEREDKKEQEISLDTPVSSVGIVSMDKEHESCEKALAKLLSSPNTKTLENALIELTNHFTHEQELMRSHGFGNAHSNDPFSAFASHVKDHERILQIGFDELGRATTGAQKKMVCSGGEGAAAS
ncbi:MAG: hypothetical protein SGILL_008603, partial [Bacillariaceae sp.]